jgi:hypothetical protein
MSVFDIEKGREKAAVGEKAVLK